MNKDYDCYRGEECDRYLEILMASCDGDNIFDGVGHGTTCGMKNINTTQKPCGSS